MAGPDSFNLNSYLTPLMKLVLDLYYLFSLEIRTSITILKIDTITVNFDYY